MGIVSAILKWITHSKAYTGIAVTTLMCNFVQSDLFWLFGVFIIMQYTRTSIDIAVCTRSQLKNHRGHEILRVQKQKYAAAECDESRNGRQEELSSLQTKWMCYSLS